ncbi:uncharacterized protein LOC125668029 [Ostrea edulis]|uniref:uncharacterized protein LOC125668029 n=1 Tax=Ostrea edulis TaxID=37623 RepID=UPI0024AFE39A|nr:uncharacterized protein LOC125668029 [Ostrea edulis]
MRRTVGNKRRGIIWTLTSILEDIDTADHLQKKTNELNINANKIGLKINKKKTKTMQFVPAPPQIKLENENLEEVNEFTYLGSTISKNNATEKDITNRLQKAKASFHQLNKIWRTSSISEKTKIRLYQSNVLSVLLYGAECWRITQKDNQRLSGFHTKCLRKICKIYWPRKISNKDLYKRTGQKDLITMIKQRQFRWLGHVIRKGNESITKTALKWTPAEGKRSRGRPRETWRRTIESDIKKMGKTWKEVEKMAMDRNKWRGLVSALCATGHEEDR